MDSAQKIGHWKVVDSRHWTLDSIENEQKIGQSPADSNWTVKFRSTLCALFLMKNFVYCSVRPTVGCPLSTVHYLLSTVHCPMSNFFCPKTFSSSFSEDSGQWTKTVKSSPGQGGRFFFLFFFTIFVSNILSHSRNYVLPFWGTQSNFSTT